MFKVYLKRKATKKIKPKHGNKFDNQYFVVMIVNDRCNCSGTLINRYDFPYIFYLFKINPDYQIEIRKRARNN